MVASGGGVAISRGRFEPRHTLTVGSNSRKCDRDQRLRGKLKNRSSAKRMILSAVGGLPCIHRSVLGSEALPSRYSTPSNSIKTRP